MAKFIELVLTALQFQTEGLLEIADIVISTPVEVQRRFLRIPTHERQWFKTSWADAYRDRQQFYRTLNHLKHQGLVVKKTGKSGSRWVVTEQGEGKSEQYRKLRSDSFSVSSISFAKPHGKGITIVAYDIPEKDRRKRNWIRMCLVEMGCEKIQKSVWVAKGSIDEDFIHALRERKLLDSVHLFAVTQKGTISFPTA